MRIIHFLIRAIARLLSVHRHLHLVTAPFAGSGTNSPCREFVSLSALSHGLSAAKGWCIPSPTPALLEVVSLMPQPQLERCSLATAICLNRRDVRRQDRT